MITKFSELTPGDMLVADNCCWMVCANCGSGERREIFWYRLWATTEKGICFRREFSSLETVPIAYQVVRVNG